jgi:hypothetical protein
MTSFSEFYESMVLDVRTSSIGFEEYPRDAFTSWALDRLGEANEVTDLAITSFQGTARNRKRIAIDAFGFDSVDGTFVALLSDFDDEDSPETITKTDLEALFGQLRAFFENCLDVREFQNFSNTEASVAAGQLLLENRGSVAKFRFYLATNRIISSRVRQLDAQALDGKPVSYVVWDMNRFFEAFSSLQGREEISINLNAWYPDGLPCLPAASTSSELLGAYMTIIRGDILASIFDTYGSRLLEGNVRSFLSARGSVNRGIRLSLLQEPSKFLAYNNGITATATQITAREIGAVTYVDQISDLQIVNGGQTTASMHDFLKRERDSSNLALANVQMKLLVVKPEASDSMVPLIARYSNSQNKVSEADFFSNSSFHRKFEELSKRLLANPKDGSQISTYWFYERARGSYVNERSRSANVKQFDLKYPKAQVVTKTDLAKFHNTWHRAPHQVSAGAQKNFLAFANSVADAYAAQELKFGELFFRQSICQAIVFKSLHRAVMKAPWYGGYAANIVTYAIARFSEELDSEGLVLDWESIWRKQDISAALLQHLLVWSEKMLQHLTDPRRPKENVTEWAKDPNCWKQAKAISLEAQSLSIPDVLKRNIEAEREEAKADRQSGVIANEAQIMSFVISLDKDLVADLISSPPGNLRVSPSEKTAVGKLLRQGLLNSDREYETVFGLLLRARSEGLLLPDLPRN